MKLRPSTIRPDIALMLALLLSGFLAAMPGAFEMGIIALVILLLFGGSKLPKLMRGMGSGITEFKKGLKEGDAVDGDDDTAADDSKSKSDED
jgi:sec-independent protein translocase protein TatA